MNLSTPSESANAMMWSAHSSMPNFGHGRIATAVARQVWCDDPESAAEGRVSRSPVEVGRHADAVEQHQPVDWLTARLSRYAIAAPFGRVKLTRGPMTTDGTRT